MKFLTRSLLILWLCAFLIQPASATALLPSPAAPALEPPSDWPERINETFDDEDGGWPLGAEQNDWVDSEWEISGGSYQWHAKALTGFNWYIHPTNSEAADFHLAVDVVQHGGPQDALYGVAFRISEDGYYLFGITNAGEYSLFGYYGDDWHTLIDWRESPAIRPGQSNRLTILAQGSRFRFAINDQQLGGIEDRGLASGKTGLLIEMFNSGDEAVFEFDNFVLHAPVDAFSIYQAGNSLFDQGKFTEAIQKYNLALEAYEENGDQDGQAPVLVSLGWLYLSRSWEKYDREDLRVAQYYLERGLQIYQQNEDHTGQAEALHDLSLVFQDQGDYTRALDASQQALSLWREAGDRAQEAWALNNLGLSRSRLYNYQAAMHDFAEAQAIFQDLEDKDAEAAVLRNMALATANNLGYRKAFEYLEAQLKLLLFTGDTWGQANTLNEMGKFCIFLGEYERGLQYFQQARDMWREQDDRLDESRALNNIGVIYSYLGDTDRALEHFEQSLDIAMEIDDPWREAIWRSNIGEVYFRYADYTKALEYELEAKELYDEVQDPRRHYAASNLSGIAAVYQKMGDFPQALSLLQEALLIMREDNESQGQTTVLHALGELHYETQAYDDAMTVLTEALRLRQQIGDVYGEAETLGLIGKVREAQGKTPEALQNYLQSIEVRESILGQVKAEAYQSTLAAQSSEVYQRAVRLLVKDGKNEQAFNLSERSRARAFLDSLGSKRPELGQAANAGLLQQESALREEITSLEDGLYAEKSKPAEQRSAKVLANIEEQLGERQKAYEELLAKIQSTSPELAALVSIPATTVAGTQAALDADTTLLAYYLTDASSLAFVITARSFRVVELPASPQEIAAAVEAFRALGLSNLGETHPRSLQNLYDWLVTPLEAELDEAVLGIIPHQALHYVPFAALYDGEAYLSERYTLYQLPSASALPLLQAKSGRLFAHPLVLGDPTTGNPALQQLSYAAQEAEQVAGLFQEQALTGEQASEQSLRQGAGAAGAVHLAVHGTLNPSAPQFSRLWLAPAGSDDGRLNLYEVYGLDLNQASLVVLSACETQLGTLSAGDEVTSLNRAFLYSVPAVISSLWPVDDAATGALMEHFYTNLKAGKGNAEALRLAQAALRSDPQHPEWAHPYYWAAFVLNGDPGQVTGGKAALPGSSTIVLLLAVLASGVVMLLGAGGILFTVLKRRGRKTQ